MAKLDPEEAAKFMVKRGLQPLVPYTNSLAKWKCIHIECGQVVFAVYNQIRKGQGGCVPCGIKKRAVSQRNSEGSIREIMIAAGVDPIVPYENSKRPWKSKCLKCGKIVSPTYSAVKNGQGACKYCSRRFVDSEDAIKLMISSGFRPLKPYAGAGTPWLCECMVCGDKSSPRFSNVQNGSKCLKCANRESGINRRTPEDIAVSQMQIAGLKPLVPFEGTKIPWKSECSTCGKTVTPTLGNVIQGHVGCGYCSGSIVDVEEANQVMQEANLEPLVPFPGADKPWLSKHKICGQKVKPSYSSIRRGQGGCKSCGSAEGGRKNLFPSDKAIDLMRNANYLPLESYIKADLPWRCECLKCHKVVYPTLSNVKSGHSKCIYCSKMKVDPEDAIALMRKFGFEPLEPYVDSKKKWKCLHLKCGNIVNPLYNSIQNRKSGCSFCAEYGLKFNEPAYLYIMEHMDYSSIKVGISNEQARPNRIKSHEKEGWVLRKKINFESGLLADYVETQILLWLRNVRKLGIHLSKDMMKQGGYSETVDSAEIDFLQIQRQVESISNSLFKIE